MKRIPAGALLTVPPDIMVSFFSGKDIEKLVSAEGMTLNGLEKIEILETATIHAYQPDFQRHHEKRIGSTSEEAQNPGTGKRSDDVGQVHAARLLDGRDVVLKVRKPGVDELVRIDLDILAGLH